jgi:hypothetical protein
MTTGSTRGTQRAALITAVTALGMLAGGMAVDPTRAFTSLLVGALLVLGLAAGALAWFAVFAVANVGWTAVVKRVLEGFAAFVPIGALLLLATTPGLRTLYEWARPGAGSDHLLASKAAYLNPPFFLARMAIVLGAWCFFSWRLRAISLAQDHSGDVEDTRRTVRTSAVFLAIFAITSCVGAFDWLMTLEARWFSTIFGLYNIAGMLVSSVTGVAIASILLRRAGLLPQLRPSHLHDLGKLMLGFATFWAYLWFSQFLLIWYANLPEETAYYELRWQGGWMPLFFANLVVNWVLPFLLLLPREAKRDEGRMLGVGALLLCGRWLDLWLMAAPANYHQRPTPGLLELVGVIGPLALFIFWVARTFQRVPLIAKNDPYLSESLHHHI